MASQAPCPTAPAPGFDVFGDVEAPSSPVVVSVPHAGRSYPPSLLAALRLPTTALAALEDRHVDAVARGAWTDETMLIQQRGRAWIDLNRRDDERDPAVDEGAPPLPAGDRSAKLRAGLGLVPRRAGRLGDLWQRRFTATEVATRLEDHHRYHAALATALGAAHARFGAAVLLDLHSMPPLEPGAARIVLGDRFGRSAAPRFMRRAEATMVSAGRVALNAPYAGGYILARHGRPPAHLHAIQVELDRSLYLDPSLDQPGDGLAATVAAVRRLIDAMAEEVTRPSAHRRAAG